jgi:TPR repeat protein
MSSAKLEAGAADAASEERYLLAVQLTEDGDPKDAPRAAELYSQGAADGHVPSMHGLGACYRNGYGIERDSEKALHWFREAANRDYRDSCAAKACPKMKTRCAA